MVRLNNLKHSDSFQRKNCFSGKSELEKTKKDMSEKHNQQLQDIQDKIKRARIIGNLCNVPKNLCANQSD